MAVPADAFAYKPVHQTGFGTIWRSEGMWCFTVRPAGIEAKDPRTFAVQLTGPRAGTVSPVAGHHGVLTLAPGYGWRPIAADLDALSPNGNLTATIVLAATGGHIRASFGGGDTYAFDFNGLDVTEDVAGSERHPRFLKWSGILVRDAHPHIDLGTLFEVDRSAPLAGFMDLG